MRPAAPGRSWSLPATSRRWGADGIFAILFVAAKVLFTWVIGSFDKHFCDLLAIVLRDLVEVIGWLRHGNLKRLRDLTGW
ncbi:MAG: hypothetical protein ACYC4S_08795 [Rhodoferax sp.]